MRRDTRRGPRDLRLAYMDGSQAAQPK